MRVLILLLCLFFPLAAQADLYKCTDGAGKVTYTNLPCSRMGLTETKVIPPPPAPAEQSKAKRSSVPQVDETPAPEKSTASAKKKKKQQSDAVTSMKPRESSDKKCAKLKDQMGKIMDEMDAARRHGYTSKQESDWDNKLRKLQAEKNRLGCF